MHNFFWGALIIAIGLVRGHSVFLGDFDTINVVFDALGMFWIGRGLLEVKRNRAALPAASDSNVA